MRRRSPTGPPNCGWSGLAASTATPGASILPLALDQPDNAHRVRTLGVGESLGPRRRTAPHLANALARLMTPDVQAQCRSVAALLDGCDGSEAAAELIEQFTR